MIRRTFRNGFAYTMVIAISSFPIQGLAKSSDVEAYLYDILACQKIHAPSERLACFDKSVAAAAEASNKGALTVITREQILKSRKELFGFPVSSSNVLASDSVKGKFKREKFDRIETTIQAVRSGAGGNWILTTEEGAVWEIYDVPSRLMTPHVGEKLQITKGILTAYFLRIGGQPAVKGRRIG